MMDAVFGRKIVQLIGKNQIATTLRDPHSTSQQCGHIWTVFILQMMSLFKYKSPGSFNQKTCRFSVRSEDFGLYLNGLLSFFNTQFSNSCSKSSLSEDQRRDGADMQFAATATAKQLNTGRSEMIVYLRSP